MADLLSEGESRGRALFRSPGSTLKGTVFVAIGLLITLGPVLAAWRTFGGKITGGSSRIFRGVMRLGTETVEQGTEAVGVLPPE